MTPKADSATPALRRAKRQALGLLLLVTAVFIATSVVERGMWLNAVKAMAEAAMVGALADWFAVVALFRRPLGLPIPHTAVIARNQARIGRNLATFVRDKFLDVPSLVRIGMIRVVGQFIRGIVFDDLRHLHAPVDGV